MKIFKIAKSINNSYKSFFNFYEEEKTLWNTLLKDEQKFSKISFDFENNEGINKDKIVYLDYKNGEYQYRVKISIYSAGGDWELPISYCRCQIEESYKKGKYRCKYKSIVIPIDGNINLINNEKGGFRAKTDEETNKKFEKITDKEIKQMFDCVKEEIEKKIKITGKKRKRTII